MHLHYIWAYTGSAPRTVFLLGSPSHAVGSCCLNPCQTRCSVTQLNSIRGWVELKHCLQSGVPQSLISFVVKGIANSIAHAPSLLIGRCCSCTTGQRPENYWLHAKCRLPPVPRRQPPRATAGLPCSRTAASGFCPTTAKAEPCGTRSPQYGPSSPHQAVVYTERCSHVHELQVSSPSVGSCYIRLFYGSGLCRPGSSSLSTGVTELPNAPLFSVSAFG